MYEYPTGSRVYVCERERDREKDVTEITCAMQMGHYTLFLIFHKSEINLGAQQIGGGLQSTSWSSH